MNSKIRGSAPGERRGGRQKGTPNKTTAFLKDAILKAAEMAGGEEGLEGYLAKQAIETPGPFLALLGKVLPLQVQGDPNNPLEVVTRIERVIIGIAEHVEGQDAPDRDTACLPTAH